MRGDEEMELGRESRLDAAIDRALRSYAEPGEVPEARVVLARVMERARVSESQRKALWIWGAAAAGLAAMVLVGLVWVLQGPRRAEIAWAPKAPGVVSVPQRHEEDGAGVFNPTLLAPETGATRMGHSGVTGHLKAVNREVSMTAESLPKRDVFPTPRPLSAEEQALVVFARQAPQEVKKAVIEDQRHWGDPISVADLQKPFLQSGSEQDQ